MTNALHFIVWWSLGCGIGVLIGAAMIKFYKMELNWFLVLWPTFWMIVVCVLYIIVERKNA